MLSGRHVTRHPREARVAGLPKDDEPYLFCGLETDCRLRVPPSACGVLAMFRSQTRILRDFFSCALGRLPLNRAHMGPYITSAS